MDRGRRGACVVVAILAMLTSGCSEGSDPSDSDAATQEQSTTSLVDPGVDGEGASVVRVVDGDTFVALLASGEEESVRLIGIDAPERDDPFAAQATAALTELIEGRDVDLVRDVSNRDGFGRLLRYVYVDGRFVNEELVRQGVAVSEAYAPDTSLQDILDAAQTVAEGRRVGIWSVSSQPSLTSTTTGSGVDGGVVISATRFDADGNDNENKNDEWVELENTGVAPADLTGWRLEDEGPNHVFVFPSGFVLEPGSRVRIFSGCGDPTSSELYFCKSGSAVWNNGGDTATLIDGAGAVVDTATE